MSNTSKYNLLFPRPWIYHSLLWLSYYIFGALISLSIHQIYDPRFYWELLSLLPPDMLLVYGNLYLLIPFLLLRKKVVLYFLALLACISVESVLNVTLHHLYGLAGSAVFASTGDMNIRNFAAQFLNGIYLLALATAIKFLKDWMTQRQTLQNKERQQVETELNFLKSQIHPHFFFNTLNNLYSLTLQKSDLAPEIVLKLSDLMSYMLYDSGAAFVPLEKEISNLENYIGLEKLRFGRRLSLSFEKEVDCAARIQVPPLILMTFVENGFKHGMNQTTGEGRILISLKVQQDQILFSIINPVGPVAAPSFRPDAGETGGSVRPSAVAGKNGLGLRNAIRRLDLLYGDRYLLDLAEKENQFHVTLKIPYHEGPPLSRGGR
ncbi:MAG TPA: sensor histidine kinase [Puia sp.]|nr:sensor histidine kinase [Puia sp.]